MENFKALWIEESEDKTISSSIKQRSVADLPEGDLLIEVAYSSLNFKDALSSKGNKGVTRSYPHTPGIDAAGKVLRSGVSDFEVGDEVIVIGYDLGMNTSGGFGQLISVPASWAVKRPEGLSLKESMILGTAGFTAALCVEKLIRNGVTPQGGKVLVTGATGGVGIVAVALLHKLGFEVVASTGKQSQHEQLKLIGANEVVDRQQIGEASSRPMLKEQWAAAVDVVGGETLNNVIKSLSYGGSVACCGLVEAIDFKASVLPFILRGVNLLGVDSVMLPLEVKQALWAKLATEWKLPNLDSLSNEIGFDELESSLDKVFNGQAAGRFVLNLNS